MITRQLEPDHRRLTLRTVAPHHRWQQVEPRFVHKNKCSALMARLSTQFWPPHLSPVSDRSFITLDGSPDGHLWRPAQFLQQAADVAFVIADAELLLDDLRHPSTGPQLTTEAIGLRSVPEEFRNQSLLIHG